MDRLSALEPYEPSRTRQPFPHPPWSISVPHNAQLCTESHTTRSSCPCHRYQNLVETLHTVYVEDRHYTWAHHEHQKHTYSNHFGGIWILSKVRCLVRISENRYRDVVIHVHCAESSWVSTNAAGTGGGLDFLWVSSDTRGNVLSRSFYCETVDRRCQFFILKYTTCYCSTWKSRCRYEKMTLRQTIKIYQIMENLISEEVWCDGGSPNAPQWMAIL